MLSLFVGVGRRRCRRFEMSTSWKASNNWVTATLLLRFTKYKETDRAIDGDVHRRRSRPDSGWRIWNSKSVEKTFENLFMSLQSIGFIQKHHHHTSPDRALTDRRPALIPGPLNKAKAQRRFPLVWRRPNGISTVGARRYRWKILFDKQAISYDNIQLCDKRASPNVCTTIGIMF